MQFVSILISLPVSVLLVLWIVRMKKEDPFPKGSVLKMVLFGVLSALLTTAVTVALGLLVLVIRLGPADVASLLTAPESAEAGSVIERLNALPSAGTQSFFSVFLSTFFMIALVEEGAKFLLMKLSLAKKGVAKTWMDVVFVGALTGLGFQIIEDINYAGADPLSAIFRAITPFHFVFGVLMGYLYGRAKKTGRPLFTVLSLLIPTLVHAIYDAGIRSMAISEYFVIMVALCTVALFALFVVQLVRIGKWHKAGTLDVPIGKAEPETDPEKKGTEA